MITFEQIGIFELCKLLCGPLKNRQTLWHAKKWIATNLPQQGLVSKIFLYLEIPPPNFFLLFYHMSHPTHTNYTLSMQRSLFLIQLASIPYIISHSYTKISQTRNQFPMHPLKTICTVKMAWHNRRKRSGTTVENALAHNELSLPLQYKA